MERRNFLAMIGLSAVIPAAKLVNLKVSSAATTLAPEIEPKLTATSGMAQYDPSRYEILGKGLGIPESPLAQYGEEFFTRDPWETAYEKFKNPMLSGKQPVIQRITPNNMDRAVQYKTDDRRTAERVSGDPIGESSSDAIARQREMSADMGTTYSNGATLRQYRNREVSRHGKDYPRLPIPRELGEV